MTLSTASLARDANGVPIQGLGFQTTKTVAFDGTAGNGAQGTITLFTVTGTVMLNAFGFCTEDLASTTGTVALGVTGSTAALADLQTATNVDNHEVWHESILAIGGLVANHFHPSDQNVILTIATADVTNGTITFYCNWFPVTSNGDVTAA